MRRFAKSVRMLLCVCLFGVTTLVFAQVRTITQKIVTNAVGFPYRITQPGSYILDSNLIVPANTDGIDISADGVTLDLNGFTISTATCIGNVPFCSGSGYGIYSSNDNTKVTNGSIVGFRNAITLIGSGAYLEKVSAKFNLVGFYLEGGGTVKNCSASKNGNGMVAYTSVVEGNTFSYNSFFGLTANSSTVIANIFAGNGQSLSGDLKGSGFSSVLSLYGSNNFGDNLQIGYGNTSQNNNNCQGSQC